MTTPALPRSTPSEQNIDARGITAFVEALESTRDVEGHSLMLLRHGAVVAEGWWAPYAPDRVHLLYSLSKSFTSTAVGFAVTEGLLDLDDTIVSHFPEFEAEVTDSRSRRIRVRHLLAMASGHRDETVARAAEIDPDDLVRGFLMIPPDEEPGTLFCYNQPCTYTLAAIVQKRSGLSLVDYLRPRLFDPLGIDDAGWLRDVSGRELGYSGLHATTEAIAKLGQLYLQGGEWNGRRLLSAEWVVEASSRHSDNSMQTEPDWRQGYGYQFWIARHGYRGDGAYGQFCVIVPGQDLVLAVTGQSLDMQAVLDAAWAHLLPAIDAGSDPATDRALADRLGSLSLPAVAPGEGSGPSEAAAGQGSYIADRTGDLPALGRIDLVDHDSRWRVVLHDHGEPLDLAVGWGEWAVTEAFAVSAVTGGREVGLDIIFLETPHRLRIALDRGALTFTARWVTSPLHDLPLRDMRRPINR